MGRSALGILLVSPISVIVCLWGAHLVGIDNVMEEPNKEQRVCGLIW